VEVDGLSIVGKPYRTILESDLEIEVIGELLPSDPAL
jgi:hypothetical protein